MNETTQQMVRPTITFTRAELERMFGLSHWTLKVWLRDGWVVPVLRGRGGHGGGSRFSLWQAFAIGLIAGYLKDARLRNTYAGKTTVMQTMEAVSRLDDALLMPIETHDAYTEEFWAVLKSITPPNQDLPQQALENGRRLMRAIYEKAAGLHGAARCVPERLR